VALLWLSHPLQTESVTYVIQRAESLAGLFFFLTLFGFIRMTRARNQRRWFWFAWSCCFLGMATKQVMATAPAILFLYDRTFVSGSFRASWKAHRFLFLALSATILIIPLCLALAPKLAGVGTPPGRNPWGYFLTQGQVVCHYLKLSFWPHPLCLDYAWPYASFREAWPFLMVLGLLGFGAVLSLKYWPRIGFLGAVFFLWLGPSSSFLPLADLAFEHRMYLPLAALLLVGFGLWGHGFFGVWAGGPESPGVPVRPGSEDREKILPPEFSRSWPWRLRIGLGFFFVFFPVFSLLTLRRNFDYADPVQMFRSNALLRPRNARAYFQWGYHWAEKGGGVEALWPLDRSLALMPSFDPALGKRAFILARLGRHGEALQDNNEILRLKPGDAETLNNRGLAHHHLGSFEKALADFAEAIRINPELAGPHFNQGNTLAHLGRRLEALESFHRAIGLKPDYFEAFNNRGNLYGLLNQNDKALRDFDQALSIKPDYAEAYINRAVAHFYGKAYALAWQDVEKGAGLGARPHPDFLALLAKEAPRGGK
jgi:tetratricopeptide (TPR) repeat protein